MPGRRRATALPEPSAAGLIEAEIRNTLTDRPVLIGLCGAQGSGKSTAAAQVQAALDASGVACAILSLDDFYRTAADRLHLARTVHPLLRTRGVPGTHDVALAMRTFDRLMAGEAIALPRFDKARDDRAPESAWPIAPPGVRVILFEGWCVGAVAENAAALRDPVNELEAMEDADGVWRGFVNDQLAGVYQPLFARLDRLILLRAPGFEVVRAWRGQQEEDLRAATGQGMSATEIDRFIQHYERLTRHILVEMPGRADLTIHLDTQRKIN